jgi:hypothetical protein
MRKALLLAATAALSLIAPAAAHAESAPGCASVKQIGATAYLEINGETAASVKQFLGCGKNFGYTFVWLAWANAHPGFDATAGIMPDSGGELGKVFGAVGQREVWSTGTNTTAQCTKAIGIVGLGSPAWGRYTERRC